MEKFLRENYAEGEAFHENSWALEADARNSEPVLKMEDMLLFYSWYEWLYIAKGW